MRSSSGPVELGRDTSAAGRLGTRTADRIAREPARAGVRGGDEGEPRREHDRAHHPRDDDATVLEGLTQPFDRVAAELRELVQEQHPVVGERHLARAQVAVPPPRSAAGDTV